MGDKNNINNHIDLSIQGYFDILRAGRQMKKEVDKDEEKVLEEPIICNGVADVTRTPICEDENEM